MTLVQSITRLFQPRPMPGPIVVGGTGGSGTRAIHAVLEKSGVFMGQRVNHAGDAMDFEPFLDGFINLFLLHGKSLDHQFDKLPPDIQEQARAYLQTAYGLYRRERPSTAYWGWKNPRSMFVLPALFDIFPNLSFIHLVRDGRDMAMSDNQNQVTKHSAALFGETVTGSPAELSIRFWAEANAQAADWGERVLQKRYLRIGFEDLCRTPEPQIKQMLEFCDLPAGGDLSRLTAAINSPDSLGRWRTLPSQQSQGLTELAAAALARFGYSD